MCCVSNVLIFDLQLNDKNSENRFYYCQVSSRLTLEKFKYDFLGFRKITRECRSEVKLSINDSYLS